MARYVRLPKLAGIKMQRVNAKEMRTPKARSPVFPTTSL